MLIDENEPLKQTKKPKPLDNLSVDELRDYIAELQAEIQRAEAAIAAKEAHMTAAAAFFKKPG